MKKTFFLLLIGLTALTLTGCRQATYDTSQQNVSSPAAENSLSASENPNTKTPISSAIAGTGTPADNIIGYPGNTILVNSSEQVAVIPDIAEVIYSVRTEEKSASACQQSNHEAVSQVITLLKDLHIAETSIKTSDYYMHPVYSYQNNTTKVVGYEATTTLTVSDLPIDNLGEILTQSVSTGINTIQSITYQAGSYDECYQEALHAAIAAAHEKAEGMATAAGCRLGSVISMQETSGYSEARYIDRARTNQLNAVKEELLSDSSASVMPGEIEVEAAVLVEYQLIPAN